TSLDSPAALGMTETQGGLPATAPAPASRQATASAAADTTGRVAPVAEGPRNTGQFPNLNIPPKTAAPQLSDAEKTQKQAALRAEQRQQAATGGSVANDQAELAKLGKTHADQTLEEIEEAARKAKAAAPAGQ